MNYRDHRITCDRSTCHGINESGGRSGYQLVSKLSDRRNEIFGIKSRMDPWNFRILGLFLGMYQFAILIIVVGGVLGMIYMIVAMMSYPNTKKDMIAYVVLIPILVATFISYFVLKEFVLSSLINNGGSTTNFLNNIL